MTWVLGFQGYLAGWCMFTNVRVLVILATAWAQFQLLGVGYVLIVGWIAYCSIHIYAMDTHYRATGSGSIVNSPHTCVYHVNEGGLAQHLWGCV